MVNACECVHDHKKKAVAQLTYLLYPRLSRITVVLLDTLIVLGVVLGTRLHLIVITSIIVDIMVCVICIGVKLIQYASSSAMLLLSSKPALSVVVGFVFIVRLISVMTLLMHHLPRSL